MRGNRFHYTAVPTGVQTDLLREEYPMRPRIAPPPDARRRRAPNSRHHRFLSCSLAVLTAWLFYACGNAPTAPPPATGAPPERVVSVSIGTPGPTMVETLDDPFIAGLLAGLDNRGAASRLDVGLRGVRARAEPGEIAGAGIALVDALRFLKAYPAEPGNPDDAVALAVLELVLRDLADMTTPEGGVQ